VSNLFLFYLGVSLCSDANPPVREDCWSADEGGSIWDAKVWGGVKDSFEGRPVEDAARAKARFAEEWAKLANENGVVREEGRLYVGIGRK